MFHFISGLPRSGSTLLGALLSQNPKFQAGMSSPLGGLISGNLKMMSAGSETALLLSEKQKQDIIKGLFSSVYPQHEDKVIFDTNRLWCSKLPLLNQITPSAKMIICVRDVPWIMDSIERLLQSNPLENTKLFATDSERSSVYSRMATLLKHDKLIGFPWAALKEAYYGPYSKNLLLVEYDLLAQDPETVLKLVYQFIGESWYEGHDFHNVEFEAKAFDEALGVPGLHKVRRKVEWLDRATVIPPDIFEKYANMSFWRSDNRSHSSVIKPKASQEEVVNKYDY